MGRICGRNQRQPLRRGGPKALGEADIAAGSDELQRRFEKGCLGMRQEEKTLTVCCARDPMQPQQKKAKLRPLPSCSLHSDDMQQQRVRLLQGRRSGRVPLLMPAALKKSDCPAKAKLWLAPCMPAIHSGKCLPLHNAEMDFRGGTQQFHLMEDANRNDESNSHDVAAMATLVGPMKSLASCPCLQGSSP